MWRSTASYLTLALYPGAQLVPPAVAQPGAGDFHNLRRRVVATYEEAARASTFVARIQKSAEAGVQSVQSAGAFEVMRSGAMTSVRSTQVSRNSLWIVAEEKVWQYTADSNEYREANRGDLASKDIIAFVDSSYERLGGRFTNLLKLNATVKLVRREEVGAGRQRHRCAVLQITPAANPSALWTEMLWIEGETALVWKSVMHWPPAQGAMMTDQTIIWDRIVIGEPPPPIAFTFGPPKHARRVFKAVSGY